MAQKHPLALVKEKFGEKSKLVEAVKAFGGEDLWLGRVASDRGKGKGLEHVSNAKLLRLHAIFTEVKAKFGTRAALVDAILASEKRTKDAGFKKRIEAYPVPRLYDAYKSSVKRNGGSSSGRGPQEAPAAAEAAPKASAKAAAEGKPAAKPKAKAAPKAKAPKEG